MKEPHYKIVMSFLGEGYLPDTAAATRLSASGGAIYTNTVVSALEREIGYNTSGIPSTLSTTSTKPPSYGLTNITALTNPYVNQTTATSTTNPLPVLELYRENRSDLSHIIQYQ